jgi:hypothetical protein
MGGENLTATSTTKKTFQTPERELVQQISCALGRL